MSSATDRAASAVYTLTFTYPESWTVDTGERHRLLLAEGRCEGRVTGRFRGANRARLRPDGTWLPDFHGAIQTDDGATILVHLAGYGWPDRGRALAAMTHLTGDERYGWLNTTLCTGRATVELPNITIEVTEVPAGYDQPA